MLCSVNRVALLLVSATLPALWAHPAGMHPQGVVAGAPRWLPAGVRGCPHLCSGVTRRLLCSEDTELCPRILSKNFSFHSMTVFQIF